MSLTPTREQIEGEIRRQQEHYPPIRGERSVTKKEIPPAQRPQLLYVWKLQDQCYFIGRDQTDLGKRWIKRHPSVGLVESISCAAKSAADVGIKADQLVLRYMSEHGWQRVRGGSFYELDENRIRQKLKDLNVFEELDKYYASKEPEPPLSPIYVYVLQLENGNYYIGQTKNIKRRANQHARASGAKWTKLHLPVQMAEVDPGVFCSDSTAAHRETELALQYMTTHGWQKVRGGAYCNPSELLHLRQLQASGYFREVRLDADS